MKEEIGDYDDEFKPPRKRVKRVKGALSADRFKQDQEEKYFGNLMLSAMSNPDLLCDEDQAMFPARDFDTEEEDKRRKAELLAAFREAVGELTERQKQVLAVLQSLKQEDAAKLLNVKRSTLAVMLMQIKKKIKKHVNKRQKSRLKVEDI